MIGIVARREIVERLRDRAFAVGTVVTLAIVAGIVFLPDVFGADGREKASVAAVTAADERVARAAAEADRAFGLTLTVSRHADAGARVRSGDADAALVSGRIFVAADAPDALVPALQAAAANAPPPLPVVSVDQAAEDRKGFAFVALLVLYGQLIGYGIWVAMGVVEEKASRIVEILLAAISARELLAGKILGIGVVGLIQLLIIAVAGIGLATVSGTVEVGGTELEALPVVLAWFVGGYAFYSCAFAVAGALISRQEDINTVTTPITIAMLAAFILSFTAIEEPDSTLARVLGFLPFSSPLVMPVRQITGEVPLWELAVSIAILVVSVLALVLLAGRVYERAALHVTGKLSLRAALRRT